MCYVFAGNPMYIGTFNDTDKINHYLKVVWRMWGKSDSPVLRLWAPVAI